MKQYIYDGGNSMEHLTVSLVLYGGPKLAKTPFAKTVASCLANLHQSNSKSEPFAIVVRTVESLPRGGDPRMKSGVPIVFDDIRPSQTRGSRPALAVEDMKVLGDVSEGGDLSARYSDLHFEPLMPRIWTSNADSPTEFYRSLPADLETMTNEQVMGLDAHVFALVKRFAFCRIDQCLIPHAVREAYEASRVSQVRDVGAQLFSGANAIP